ALRLRCHLAASSCGRRGVKDVFPPVSEIFARLRLRAFVLSRFLRFSTSDKRLETREGSQRRFFCAKAGGVLRFQAVQRLDEGDMDGVMLMKGAPSRGLAVGRDVGARQHHPAAKVSTLGPRAAAGAGGGSAAEASGPAADARHSYMFPLRLDRLWPGRRGAVAGKRKASEETAVAERAEDSQVLKEVPAEQRSDNWVLKILRVRSVWAEREGAAAGGGDREAAAVEDGDRCVGCGSGGHEDGSEGCVIDGVEEEEKLVFDRESFSRLLRRVSLVETELYAKMAYLGSLAYIVSKIKPKNLLKCYGLRFVASSLENNGKSLNSDEAKKPSQDQELKEENGDSEEIDTMKGNSTSVSASAAYQIAASTASDLQYRTPGVLPYGAARTKDGEKPVEGSSDDKQDRSVSPEEVSHMGTTKLVTQVVAGQEEMKQAIAEDLNSSQSLPCEWYICDDDSSATRYFVIQGSETLASWQTNLLFEPIQFEGLDVPVHRGIYEAAKGMYQQMLPAVRTHLKSHGKSATFRFTGHSLGGSLALLVNLMLLIRGEVPATSLLPVITFGAPSIMCGGDYLLRKLGLPKYHVQAITMHRDIVPRAFSCNYPDHVAKILNAVNGNFRNHPCLKNQKLLYAPMGKLLILQPEEKFSPHHHLLPPGSGLYILDNSSVDSYDSERLLQAASLAFLNSPHPLQILSDPSAYGSEGTIYRDHDTNSYLRSIRGVVRQEHKLIRKARREHRRRMWWPLVATQDVHATVVTTRSVGSTNSNQNHFSFASVLHGGSRTLQQFARLVASQHVHMFVVLYFPARLLLLGALSLVNFS
ncbi:Lipase (class 3), partial [Musa troglodytarum]